MRIHYTATIWHGGFYEFFGRALKSLGHDVYFFDERGTKLQRFFERAGTRIPKFAYKAGDIFRGTVSRDWLRSVRSTDPDLIILQHAPNVLPEAIREARSLARPIFYWMDSPPAGSQAKDILAGLQYADKIFTIDREWMTILYRPEHVIYLPLAGDPEVFRPLSAKSNHEYDVVFVGSMPPQSGDGYLRAKILSDIPTGYRIGIYGAGIEYWYKYFPSLSPRIARSGQLSAEELNGIYNRSKLVLNIHSTWHATSVSARTYEIALAGAFQLVDFRRDLEELFPRGTFVTFRSAKEVSDLVAEWLTKPVERTRMSANAREEVLAHHTWRHRAEKMLDCLK